jgi:hypothetical protein
MTNRKPWLTYMSSAMPPGKGGANRTAANFSAPELSAGRHSVLSIFQKIGVAGPSSTPVSDLRQALGARNWPSGT